jgi:vesicle-fusing ATPase
VSAANLSREIVEDNIKVTMDDFMSAVNEVKPAFGAAINILEMCRFIFLDCFQTNCFQIGFVSNSQ